MPCPITGPGVYRDGRGDVYYLVPNTEPRAGCDTYPWCSATQATKLPDGLRTFCSDGRWTEGRDHPRDDIVACVALDLTEGTTTMPIEEVIAPRRLPRKIIAPKNGP